MDSVEGTLGWSHDYYDHERALLFEKLALHAEKVVTIHDGNLPTSVAL